MTAVVPARTRLASAAAPLARLYIRYSPWGWLKPALWRRVHWRPQDQIASTRFGAVFACHSLDLVQGYIYYFGVWEPNLTAFVIRRLKGLSGRTFVDVGANVGYYSILAAQQLSGGQVVAIEAFPSIYSKLRRNIGLNGIGCIRTIPMAATEQDCELQMYHAGTSNEGATTALPGIFSGVPVAVPGRPLSVLLTADEVASLRLLKIDVEGAELDVVRGLAPILSQCPADAEFVVEIAVDERATVDEIFAIFSASGYHPYGLVNSYDAASYLTPPPVQRPRRLPGPPSASTDVVFSRLDAECL